jgi:Rad3-related DNA helicase
VGWAIFAPRLLGPIFGGSGERASSTSEQDFLLVVSPFNMEQQLLLMVSRRSTPRQKKVPRQGRVFVNMVQKDPIV